MKGGHLSSADSPDWLIEDSGALRLGGAARAGEEHAWDRAARCRRRLRRCCPNAIRSPAATADAKLYLTGAIEQSDAAGRRARRRAGASFFQVVVRAALLRASSAGSGTLNPQSQRRAPAIHRAR